MNRRDAERTERSPVEAAVVEGRDPGWEELLALADHVGPSAALATVDDRALERLVTSGAARLAAEMCRWLDLVAELVVRRVWAEQGARTPAVWLSWAVGVSSSTARDHVRVALRLRELPQVREAFASGRTSYSKVRAICRVAVAETEAELLMWSQMATGADMERIVTGFRTAQRGVHPSPAADPRCGAWLRDRGDGSSEVVIRLPDERAQALHAGAQRLVDLEEAELRRAGDGDTREPERSAPADSADSAESALVAAVAHQDRPRSARLADVILSAVQAAVAAGGADTTGADRHTLVVHVDADDLEAPDAGPSVDHRAGGTAETRYGVMPWLSRRVLRRLACEAGVVLVATRGDGTPIDVGHRQRRLTTALRRALLARDRSCRFPGCGARRHLHGHHIRHWADGGPTDLANLAVVCSFHHRYLHEHDIDIELRPGGAHEFVFPDGRRVARVRSLPHVDTSPSVRPAAAPTLGGEDDAGQALRPVHWDGRYCLDTTVAVLQQQVYAVLPHAAGALAA